MYPRYCLTISCYYALLAIVRYCMLFRSISAKFGTPDGSPWNTNANGPVRRGPGYPLRAKARDYSKKDLTVQHSFF